MVATAEPVTDLIPTRQSLLVRLKDWDDNESWRDFFETYWRLIYSGALKAGLTDAEAQDVVQETVIAVARKMADFKYDPVRGSFKGWLLKLTQWRVIDQFRKRGARREAPPEASGGGGGVEAIPEESSAALLEGIWEEEWQQNLLERAIEVVKTKVSPRVYQTFQLYVEEEWPVDKVVTTLGVSAAQVYMAKYRVARLLKKEIKRLQALMF